MSIAASSNQHVSCTKGKDIAVKTIKITAFSYAYLHLLTGINTSHPDLDEVTARTYTMLALTQYFGITGSAVSFDILKVEGKNCWIRFPNEDLSTMIAALGGWVGSTETDESFRWSVRRSGNWLGTLVGEEDAGMLWSDRATTKSKAGNS